jgi:ABC-type branched-subunit amino acid transport system ATPase component
MRGLCRRDAGHVLRSVSRGQENGNSTRAPTCYAGAPQPSRGAAEPAGLTTMRMIVGLDAGAALLGDPPVLIFDEPVNGLDPEGILWVRKLLQSLAAVALTRRDA